MSESDKSMIGRFCKNTVIGCLIDWLEGNLDRPLEEILHRMDIPDHDYGGYPVYDYSVAVLWGIRASIIVGTSIPISIVLALIAMSAMGFTLNVISLISLVLGMGMMVDNSINVLDGCFRAKEKMNFYDAAIEGSRSMIGSITGGTITTCVVFLPLALVSGLLKSMQNWYRTHMPSIIPKTKLVMGVSLLLLAFSLFLATRLDLDLMSSVDEGIVQMTVKTKPGLSIETVDDILSELEEMVMEEEDVDHYLVIYGSSGLSVGGGSDQIEIDLQCTDYDSLKAAANALAQLSTAI